MSYLSSSVFKSKLKVQPSISLPSSFQGSTKNMKERFYDAMAIVNTFGKPDLFLTMTCNPKWKDITCNILENEDSFDRPDIVARVFDIKLKSLLNDIVNLSLLGKVNAYVMTIEFQKRGLPHAHMLFFLSNDCKVNTEEKIDQYITAELPDIVSEPELYDIVMKTMVHGPCNVNNPNLPCIQNGTCIKKFPKCFSEKTSIIGGEYPIYQRRSNVKTIYKNKSIDNSWIIPYNKYLTKKYACHINVECCQSFTVVKYLFKYIYKGYDCAEIALIKNDNDFDLTRQKDETIEYMNTRYICAPEAMWKLLQNELYQKSHSVYRLALHLPDEQMIYYNEGEERTALSLAANKKTHLEAWFKLNQTDIKAKQYLYSEIPKYYTWQKEECYWKWRKQRGGNVIVRIYPVSPKEIELFHLRLLLQHVRGAESYEELRTVNNVLHDTFKQAAVELQLTEDDIHWQTCLSEASNVCSPAQMRFMFCLICIYNFPQNILNLYENFKDFFIQDYINKGANFDESCQQALLEIEKLLIPNGLTCKDLKLPLRKSTKQCIQVIQELIGSSQNLIETTQYLVSTLNKMQKRIFKEITNSFNNSNLSCKCFFIDGPGGSGKTYLYNVITSYFKSKGETVLSYATTGIASDLLVNGRTVHSGFKLPLTINEKSTSGIETESDVAKTLATAAVIIIDEVSMLSKYAFEIIDDVLRRIMNNQTPFGGKLLILGGDFRQTAVIIPRGTSTDIAECCIKNSYLWTFVKKRSLTINMRCKGEKKFNQWLLNLGDGKANIKDIKDINNVSEFSEYTKVLSELLLDSKGQLIEYIYGNHIRISNDEDLQKMISKVILSPKNKMVKELNSNILDLLFASDEKVYYSTDSVNSEDPNDLLDYQPEFLNGLDLSGLPLHKLRLKPNAMIVLLRNLNPQKGLLNGTRLIVKSLHQNFIKATIVTGQYKNDEIAIPRIDLTTNDQSLPFQMKRRQLPVSLAFAMTINKAQGQTFEKVGVYLPEPVFSHGQLYVACSRCKTKKNLKIVIENEDKNFLTNSTRNITKNIIIPELLK